MCFNGVETEYAIDGRKSVQRYFSPPEPTPNLVVEQSYDDAGRIVARRLLGRDGQQLVRKEHVYNTPDCYGGNGFVFDGANKRVGTIRANCDASGRLTRIVEEAVEGENILRENAFSYDEHGRWTGFRTTTHKNGVPRMSTTHLDRDDRGFIVTQRSDLDGDGVDDQIQVDDISCWTLYADRVVFDPAKLPPPRNSAGHRSK